MSVYKPGDQSAGHDVEAHCQAEGILVALGEE